MAPFWFIRHGETDWNVEGRLQGQRDIPLNARGRRQARRCGVILRDLITRAGLKAAEVAAVASPLGRARETMELLRTELALDPLHYEIEARLQELSFGDWEGFTYPELRTQDASAVAARERDKWRYVLPGGESYEMLMQRLRPWLAGVASERIVVAHGGTARALIALMGIAAPAKAARIDIDQGIVYRFAHGSMARYD